MHICLQVQVVVSNSLHIKNNLIEALQKKLPGEDAHRRMLPNGRELYPEKGLTNMIQSSVLMLIFPEDGELKTCLIRRPANMRNHGGQIAFPGGRFEPSDIDLVRTALRESFEEIGLNDESIEVLGALTPIYVQVSNFTINPIIGWCEKLPRLQIDNQEVDELFIIPFKRLFHPKSFLSKEVITPRGRFFAPGYFIEPMFIWGATAMILSEFKEIYTSILKESLRQIK